MAADRAQTGPPRSKIKYRAWLRMASSNVSGDERLAGLSGPNGADAGRLDHCDELSDQRRRGGDRSCRIAPETAAGGVGDCARLADDQHTAVVSQGLFPRMTLASKRPSATHARSRAAVPEHADAVRP